MKVSLQDYEQMQPAVAVKRDGRRIVYTTPNTACLKRAESLLTKEPGTIEWLDALPEGAVLVDVGANVGMYSLYAAIMRNARVFAFEPESQNYATLCRNIVANQLGSRVVAWCAALSDHEGFDRLHLSEFKAGSSCHSFAEARDPYLREATMPFTQGCNATTLDRLVEQKAIPVPHAIKIDVDGFEHKVVRGAENTLRNPVLSTLLIEINPSLTEHRWIIEHLANCGFAFDPAQVAAATRQDGYFKGVAEYVFRR